MRDFFLKYIFYWFFERERETPISRDNHWLAGSLHALSWGSSPQPRPVPWLGTEPQLLGSQVNAQPPSHASQTIFHFLEYTDFHQICTLTLWALTSYSTNNICCFGVFQHEMLWKKKQNKTVDKMKTTSYHFVNARVSHTKFIKMKLQLPVPDSVFVLGLESRLVLYTWLEFHLLHCQAHQFNVILIENQSASFQGTS